MLQIRGLLWDSDQPHLTPAIRDVFLGLVPCIAFFLFSPIEIWSPKSKHHVSWTSVNISRIACCITLHIINLIHVFAGLFIKSGHGTFPLLTVVTSFIMSLAYLWAIFLLWRSKRRGFVRCGIVWLFAFAVTVASIITLIVPTINEDEDDGRLPLDYYFRIGSTPFVLLLLLLCSISDHVTSPKQAVSPYEAASFPSFLAMALTNHLLLSGWQRDLTPADMFVQPDSNKSAVLEASLKKHLVTRTPDGEEKFMPVTGALCRTFGLQFLMTAVFRASRDGLEFAKPLMLKWLLSFLSTGDEAHWHGLVIVSLILSAGVASDIMTRFYTSLAVNMGIRIRSALMLTIYKKSLKMSNSSRRERTTGEIMNLMSVDTDQFRNLVDCLHSGWAAPVQILIAVLLLYWELGASGVVGVAVLVLMTPVNIWLSGRMKDSQKEQMRHKDERVKLMGEVLTGMKVIKLQAWEQAFADILTGVRIPETAHILRVVLSNSCLLFSANIAPVLVSICTFALYVLVDDRHELTPARVFFCLSLFNQIKGPISELQRLTAPLISTRVALSRMHRFFSAPDRKDYVQQKDDAVNDISMQTASLSWDAASPITAFRLSVDLNVPTGSLVAVVGAVGSGKSSLLSAMLGETELVHGCVNIASRVRQKAYVPQQAWIMHASVKQNILFGRQFDDSKYKRIIKLCELESDLILLPAGDETEIGEKGINLSGGQKQRISIARACYSDADLFLFDDPLSALDAHVAKKIFANVFSSSTGLLKDRTRVLVTNCVAVLPEVDMIHVMKNGTIAESGNYEELMSSGNEFLSHATISDTTSSTEETPTGAPLIERRKSVRELRQEVSENEEQGVLIQEEKMESGVVRMSTFLSYAKKMPVPLLIISFYVMFAACDVAANLWLSEWSDARMHNLEIDETASDVVDNKTGLSLYAGLSLSSALFLLLASVTLARSSVTAGNRFHQELLTGILRSPMSFFETTPLGRILNRYSKDLDTIDSQIFAGMSLFMTSLLQAAGAFLLICIAVPTFALPFVPLICLFLALQRFFAACMRQQRRMESTTRSLVYANLSETLSGTASIRAYGLENWFLLESESRIDINMMVTQTTYDVCVGFGVWMGTIGNLSVLFASLFSLLSKTSMDPGLTGLAVTYAFQVSSLLATFLKAVVSVELCGIALERVIEYANNQSEAEWRCANPPDHDWPDKGCIQLTNYSARYRKGMDLVLKDLSISIRSGEKVGIVGRTGAGKSTITLSLFRLIEAADGVITIDGIDTSTIGLHDLRSKLTIIPQEPVLFSGTLRRNLDPLGEKSDEELWRALKDAHLEKFASDLDAGLDHVVAEGGENLSVGERQLICLARALLRRTSILVMDEATAAVDPETDSLIQATIGTHFSCCTVLTIAHRIQSVIDSDRILVMEAGRVAEFAPPQELLRDENSIFSQLVADAGMKAKSSP